MAVRIDTVICANQYRHRMTCTEVGDAVPTHRHSYGHVLEVQWGMFGVWSEKDGLTILLVEGQCMDIPAGVAHDIELLAVDPRIGTGRCCCCHVIRDEQGNEYLFEYEATPRELCEATGRL